MRNTPPRVPHRVANGAACRACCTSLASPALRCTCTLHHALSYVLSAAARLPKLAFPALLQCFHQLLHHPPFGNAFLLSVPSFFPAKYDTVTRFPSSSNGHWQQKVCKSNSDSFRNLCAVRCRQRLVGIPIIALASIWTHKPPNSPLTELRQMLLEVCCAATHLLQSCARGGVQLCSVTGQSVMYQMMTNWRLSRVVHPSFIPFHTSIVMRPSKRYVLRLSDIGACFNLNRAKLRKREHFIYQNLLDTRFVTCSAPRFGPAERKSCYASYCASIDHVHARLV